MSSQKDILIKEAQRFIQRGQLDKAVKAYVKAVSLDPSAVNLRQRLADLLIKAGQPDDARTEFESIGKYYASNGFYLKSIAVYKQVLKLFPGDIITTLTLADLNEKHGLIGDALAEYKLAYYYYKQEGNASESLKILEKMQGVDSQNVNIKFKLAEAYYHAGNKDDSYEQFLQLAMLLQERGDTRSLVSLNSRIQQIFPEKTAFIVEVLEKQLEEGNAAKALSGLQALLRDNPEDKKVWELITRAYRRLGQLQQLKSVYQHFLRYFPDETSAKTGLIACHADLKDIKGALGVLDRYEQDIVSSGTSGELVPIYRNLAEIDPINPRILEGLRKASAAAGMHEEAAQLESKLRTFQKLSAKAETCSAPAEPCGAADELFAEGGQSPGALESADRDRDMDAGVYIPERGEQIAEVASAAVNCGGYGTEEQSDAEIEIVVDIDDIPFESMPVEGDENSTPDGWPELFCDVADEAATAPSSVKIGSSLDGTDAQSHYDLGVAFKEMGLYNEAFIEFHQAAGDPARRVESLVLQAACLRERGELDTAEGMLNALMKPGLSLEDACTVKYGLALVLKAQGRVEMADTLMGEIDAMNAAGSLDFSEEELQGFGLE